MREESESKARALCIGDIIAIIALRRDCVRLWHDIVVAQFIAMTESMIVRSAGAAGSIHRKFLCCYARVE